MSSRILRLPVQPGHLADYLPSFGRTLGGVLLAVLLLGWAAELKVGSQLGVGVAPDSPIVAPALFGLAGLIGLVAFGALEVVSARRPIAWWLRIALAATAGLAVGLTVLALGLTVPRWQETSRVSLLIYLGLVTLGGAWLTAGSVRSAAPLRWRSILHPVWLPLLLGLALILAGLALAGLRTGQPGQSRSLLADPRDQIRARYLPEVTRSTEPLIENWEGQRAMAAAPPSEIEIDTHIPSAARLSLTAGLRPSLFVPAQAGVRFQVEWFSEGKSQLLYDGVVIQQNVNRYGDREPIELDLRYLAGQEGRLLFRTIPVGVPPGPILEAAWLNPRIVARAPLAPTEALIRDGCLSIILGFLISLWLRTSHG